MRRSYGLRFIAFFFPILAFKIDVQIFLWILAIVPVIDRHDIFVCAN